MEIDNSRIAPTLTAANDQGASVQKRGTDDTVGTNTAAAAPARAGQADQVSLTGEARLLRALEAEIATRPVVDSQRVNEVRNAIENGTFRIRPEQIAEKMISLEQALTDAR